MNWLVFSNQIEKYFLNQLLALAHWLFFAKACANSRR
jgi:hypothetical protein